MKNFLELCELRHSVRSFVQQSVKQDDLAYIMECVRLAPSAVNRQPWRFIHVKPEEKELILQCYKNPWFVSAPDYIIVCCDHTTSWHRPNDQKDHGDIDIAIAVEHFCLAAAERGVGTCWVCNFDAALCKVLFHLPQNLEPLVLLPIGYPDPDFQPRERTRFGMEDIWKERPS